MNALSELAEKTNREVSGEKPSPSLERIEKTINMLSDYLDNLDGLFERVKDAA